ncbi:MAG TPA: hypothetical protein VN787_04190 [Steroidobacteraceae bacterium]|nr:hypothetical protein [Steroidobacteraceae bacterium]
MTAGSPVARLVAARRFALHSLRYDVWQRGVHPVVEPERLRWLPKESNEHAAS